MKKYIFMISLLFSSKLFACLIETRIATGCYQEQLLTSCLIPFYFEDSTTSYARPSMEELEQIFSFEKHRYIAVVHTYNDSIEKNRYIQFNCDNDINTLVSWLDNEGEVSSITWMALPNNSTYVHALAQSQSQMNSK